MKRIIYTLSIFAIVATSACKKEVSTPKKTGTTTPVGTTQLSADQFVGTWKVIGNMVSAGGPMYFVPATGNDAVSFKSDGTMSGSAFPNFVSYSLKTDNRTVVITKTDTSNYQNYLCQISSDTLTMSPSGPIVCIEGCAIKLVKQ